MRGWSRLTLFQLLTLATLDLASTALAVAAEAPSFDMALFDTPDLDAVTMGSRDAGTSLTPYRFEGERDWPAIRLYAKRPLDWRNAAALAVPVENLAETPFELLLRLDDRVDANGDDRSLTGVATLPPHARVTVVLPFGPAPTGMRGRPPSAVTPQPDDLLMPDVRGTVEASHIVALHISGVRRPATRTLLIGVPTLRDGVNASARFMGPIADGFGQAIAGDWPEKVHGEVDLRSKLATADGTTARLLAARPAADPWGGTGTERETATGFFRTGKIAGRWVLITPAGHAFFSLGVDAVQSTNPTIVTGREALFDELPDTGSGLGRFIESRDGRQTYDIGRADIARGLGADWQARWSSRTIGRLKAWGFNTLGNWSAEDLATHMPHVTFTDVEGASAMVPMGGRALVDPFDPAFTAVADAVARTMTERRTTDPGLIGYFSGNELPWGEPGHPASGIAAHVLALGPDSPARRALIADLRHRYQSIAALAAAWGVSQAADWDAPITVPDPPSVAARADIERFEESFAERYFAIVATALKRHDPNHLYLGTRFAAVTPAVVRACARWCDVMSFNVYGSSPDATNPPWRGLDRPVLIGEFHFGSLDRGSFWPGMVAVAHEQDRGPAYAAYLQAAVADPTIVGVHWYQYADEPLTGRPYDGENGHIGLVAITDVPYAGFVAAVAAANRQALDVFDRAVTARR